ncbi:MAG: NAD(P)-dependent oxidoreductase [Gemmatimonadota bacterium]
MKIAITGADRPLGALFCRGLAGAHEVRPFGWPDEPGQDLVGLPYRRLDLRIPFAVRPAVEGVDLIVHAMPYDPPQAGGAAGDQVLLDQVARGTYVLVRAACDVRIGRLILISQMALMEDYPADFAVREDWIPLPRATGAGLAPYTAELVCREIARIGRLEVICLRMGALGQRDGTREADALGAVEQALWRPSPGDGYCWSLHHVVSGGRFARSR